MVLRNSKQRKLQTHTITYQWFYPTIIERTLNKTITFASQKLNIVDTPESPH